MSARRFALLAAAAAAASAPAIAEPAPGFDRLTGAWRCAGHFVANNRAIASRIVFTHDAATQSLIVRHDDDAPAAYHALEVWTVGKDAAFRASISDAYSGMRWLASAGWAGDTLAWRRPADGAIAEQFAYTLEPSGTLRVDWSTARKDGTLALGDTLTCQRV